MFVILPWKLPKTLSYKRCNVHGNLWNRESNSIFFIIGLRLNTRTGKYGWAFGGYLEVERGGPKYRIPEAELEFMLGNQP